MTHVSEIVLLLQITSSEFETILTSLTEASQVTFLQKSVECSLPCLFLSTMIVTAVVCFSIWFLVTGKLIVISNFIIVVIYTIY